MLLFFVIGLAILGVFFIKQGFSSLSSPIPPVNASKVEEHFVKNIWFPKVDKSHIYSDAPQISGKSALIVNFDTGEVIYDKSSKSRLPGASTVKIMTALVAIEHAKLNDKFVVSAKAAEIGEDSMGLVADEKLSVENLLYGLMLPSGNDAAVSLAEGVGKTEHSFVAIMNSRANEIGLTDTKYINASGLDVDGEEQYTSAYDLATLSHYTWLNYPDFSRVASTYHISIDENADHKAFDLYNETNLLTTYPGVRGIKPGFTWSAGYCLVTYAENKGVKLLAVIMGSENRRLEMKELLDYGFGKYGIKVAHPALD